MKHLALILLALVMLFAAAGAEEVFMEESFLDAGTGAEEFFSEESFFGDVFAAEDAGDEVAAEEAEEADDRSVVTLVPEFEAGEITGEELKGDGWWKAAPLLVAEAGKKDGLVTLRWVQDSKVTGAKSALPVNVKYYVYSYEFETGAWKEIKKVGAAKKPVEIKHMETVEGKEEEVTVTGIGGMLKLKKQPAYARYMVRAEMNVKGAETYGLASEFAEYEYSDPYHDTSWQNIKILPKEEGLSRLYKNVVLLSWESECYLDNYGYYIEEPYIDDYMDGFEFDYQITRTFWIGKEKRTTTATLMSSYRMPIIGIPAIEMPTIEMPVTLVGIRGTDDTEPRYVVSSDGRFAFEWHCERGYGPSRGKVLYELYDYTIPDGATKVSYKITPLRKGYETPKKKSKSRTLKLVSDAWKNVYDIDADVYGRKVGETMMPFLELEWEAEGGIADSYVLTGFDGPVSFDLKDGVYAPTVGKKAKFTISPEDCYFSVAWSIKGTQYRSYSESKYDSDNNVTVTTYEVSKNGTKITDEAEKKAALETLSSGDAEDITGDFRVIAPAKLNKKLQVKAAVQAKLGKKKGKKSATVEYYEETWKWSNGVYNLMQTGDQEATFDFYPKYWEEGVEYVIGGLAGPVTVQIQKEIKTPAAEGVEEEAAYTLVTVDKKNIGAKVAWKSPSDPEQPERITIKSSNLNSQKIQVTAKVKKAGVANITLKAQKGPKEKGNPYPWRDETIVLAADQKIGAIVQDLSKNSVSFLALNPKAKSYRVSMISGSYNYLDNKMYKGSSYIEFGAENAAYVSFEAAAVADVGEEGLKVAIINNKDSDKQATITFNKETSVFTVKGFISPSSYTSVITVLVETILEDGTRILNTKAMPYIEYYGTTEPAGIYTTDVYY